MRKSLPVDLDAAARSFRATTGRVRNVAAFADTKLDAQLELLGHRDLDLGVFARPRMRTRSTRPFGPTIVSCSLQAY